MHTIPRALTFTLVLLVLFLVCSNLASAITRCIKNGSTTYTDLPCPEDSIAAPFTGHVAPPDDPEAARQRYVSDQKKLHQIQLDNEELDQQQQRDAQSAAQYTRQAKAREDRCKNLDTRRKQAQLNTSKNKPGMNKHKSEQAQLLAVQAENNYAAQCSTE